MQTFLPYPSFARSAAVLDDRRLGKQRVEVLQILRALHVEGYGWANHPAVLMWRGHARALVAYGLATVAAWTERGYADTTRQNISEFARPHEAVPEAALPAGLLPPWLGWDPLHRSHRAALVRKDPGRYGAAFPDAVPELPYFWPDPPAGPAPEEPFSAWVVRAPAQVVLDTFRTIGAVGLPARFGVRGATPKQRRQHQRLGTVARPGERVAVPVGSHLHCGVLAGAPADRDVGGEAYLVRPVTWDRTVSRSDLRRPYQLQDPQLVFALRGEPAVDA